MKELVVIAAVDRNLGIGRENQIPWDLPEDREFFKRTTTSMRVAGLKNVLVMGSKTFASLPGPLSGRISVVITRQDLSSRSDTENLRYRNNLHQTIQELQADSSVGDIFIIGGQEIYTEFLSYYTPHKLYLTMLIQDYHCDRFFPMHLVATNDAKCETLTISATIKGYLYHFNRNSEEENYLNLCRNVLVFGNSRSDRTGTGTNSLFGQKLEFSLRHHRIPVLTTKKVAFKTLAKELLWFLSGSTNSKILEQQGVRIWQGNTSAEFLARRGLNYQEGDLGPGYGFQWRHAGAEYRGMEADYQGQGVDQIANLIKQLKEDPYSRRLVLSAWNVADLDKMALPPCHILYQLYVHNDGGTKWLSAQVYQRSADAFLGVPFNISSYALLTHILAEIVGYQADRLVMIFGDFHVYQNHIEQMKEQISRDPYQMPHLRFTRLLKDAPVESITLSDFELINYQAHPTISAPMAV